jgi:hypothetical protein
MILVPGKNPIGNVLHVIMGPESELYMDLHGSQIVDITAILNMFDKSVRVVLHVTRSCSERDTIEGLIMAGAPVASTHGSTVKSGVAPQAQPDAAPAAATAPAAPVDGVCSYCAQHKAIVSTAAWICESCLQIELGLRKQRAQKKKDVPE